MQSEVILLSSVKQDNIAELIQKQFKLLGITGAKGKIIDSNEETIGKYVSDSLSQYHIIVIIGGMGLEDDFITVKGVSKTVGFQSVMKDGELFPKGAEILKNKHGKASGCVISQGNQCIMMLPGDSESIQFMLCYRATRYLADFIGGSHVLKIIRARGITKSFAENAVNGAGKNESPTVVFEDDGEIAISVYSTGDTLEEAKQNNTAKIKEIISSLGASVYAIDAENVGQALYQELKKKDLTVSMAIDGMDTETASENAKVYEFGDRILGRITNSNLYDIPEKLISRNGKNSDKFAGYLSGEVAKRNGANIGIAITANQGKLSEGANIAVSLGDNLWTEHVFAPTTSDLSKETAEKAIHLARKIVSAYPKSFEGAVPLKDAVSGKTKMNTSSTSVVKKKWYEKIIPVKGDQKSEIVRKSIFLFCVLVFLGSMIFLGTKVLDGFNHRGLASNLHNMLNIEAPDDWEYLDELYALYQENEDLIGYIKIDGTNVDFPVVQTTKAGDKGETGQFYLRKDYYGKYSMYGTPFLDYRCSIDPEFYTKNLIVYGHNIYDDGQMFANLIKYEKLSYYKEHPIIHFNSLFEKNDYLIIGSVVANAYAKDGPLWDYNNFIDGTEEETKEFISQIAKRTLIVTGVDYNIDDEFLTLSTCSYKFKDARIVIFARKVREGEDISNFDTSKAYYNSNPLMPDAWYKALAEAQKKEADAAFGEAENPGSASNTALINGTAEKITVLQGADQYTFVKGQPIDLSSLQLSIVYLNEDGEHETKILSYEECVANGIIENIDYTALEVGQHQLTFKYNGLECYYMITILEEGTQTSDSSSSASEADVTVKEIKYVLPQEYTVGDKIDASKIKFTAIMSDGTTKEINSSEVTLKTDSTLSKTGDTVVEYEYGGKTYYINIKVKEKEVTESSVTAKTAVDNKTFTEGDTINKSDLVFTVKMSDGTTKEIISEDITLNTNIVPSSGKISYTYNGKTYTLIVSVTPKQNNNESSNNSSSTSESQSSTSESQSSTSESQSSTSESQSSTSESQSSDLEPPQELLNMAKPLKAVAKPVTNQSDSSSSIATEGQSAYYEQSLVDTIKVNGTNMSVYEAVCRVVQYEAGNAVEEYVKTQVVASYTYLKNQGSPTGVGMSQMSSVTAKTKRIVAQMIGYAVLDDASDNYILATYFSSGPGCTISSKDVWGGYNRNLLAVSYSPEDTPDYVYKISPEEFKEKMGTAYKLSGDPEDWIYIESYIDNTPYVEYVSIGGQTIKGRTLREKFLGGSNLRSVAFDVEYDSENDLFIFTSHGYGHGAGMSAQGAIAYANDGYKWDEILLSYYSNCYIDMKY